MAGLLQHYRDTRLELAGILEAERRKLESCRNRRRDEDDARRSDPEGSALGAELLGQILGLGGRPGGGEDSGTDTGGGATPGRGPG